MVLPTGLQAVRSFPSSVHLPAMPARRPIRFFSVLDNRFLLAIVRKTNPLAETAPPVYTFNLVMIRRPISPTTNYAGT